MGANGAGRQILCEYFLCDNSVPAGPTVLVYSDEPLPFGGMVRGRQGTDAESLYIGLGEGHRDPLGAG